MCFTRLIFYYDENGNPLADIRPDGEPAWKPRIVTAKAIRSKRFYLISDHGRDGSQIRICREYANLKTDPYNDDDRPPVVLTTLVHPTVLFAEDSVEIIGFERPNLCWAGKVREVYQGCPPLQTPKELVLTFAESERRWKRGLGLVGHAKQLIKLLPK